MHVWVGQPGLPRCQVFLDGKRMPHAIEADEERGYVIALVPLTGNYPPTPGMEPLGTVHFATKAHRTLDGGWYPTVNVFRGKVEVRALGESA